MAGICVETIFFLFFIVYRLGKSKWFSVVYRYPKYTIKNIHCICSILQDRKFTMNYFTCSTRNKANTEKGKKTST